MKLGHTLKKKLMPLALATAMFFTPFNRAKACTGTKQLAMGDAGITIADNSHATYWNQAILPYLESSEISFTKAVNGAEGTGYDDVLAFAIPLKDKNVGIGLHFTNTDKLHKESGLREKTQWIKFAAGMKLTDNKETQWNHSIGGAITPKIMEKEYNGKTTKGNKTNYEISYFAKKQNVFSNDDTLRLGFLLRRNQTLSNTIFNFRPGISYTKPNRLGDLTLSASCYNADNALGLENSDYDHGPRIGLEQKIGDKLALRVGTESYKMGKKRERIYSLGVGYEGERIGIGLSGSFSKDLEDPYGLAEISLKF